jgi:hypothetical protein
MFIKKIKLGSYKFFLTHKFCANLALNIYDLSLFPFKETFHLEYLCSLNILKFLIQFISHFLFSDSISIFFSSFFRFIRFNFSGQINLGWTSLIHN